VKQAIASATARKGDLDSKLPPPTPDDQRWPSKSSPQCGTRSVHSIHIGLVGAADLDGDKITRDDRP